MTTYAAFLPFIIPFVHDCSDPAAMIAARFACADFCQRTDWLQQELEPITVQAGVADYDIETFEDTLPLRVLTASLDGVPLTPVTQEDLQRNIRRDWRQVEGQPNQFVQITSRTMRLVPSPTDTTVGGLKLLISVQPTLDALDVDDDLYDRHAEAIGYGARARLKEIAGQPGYDPQGAADCWRRFYALVGEAKVTRKKDMTTAVQHVRMRTF